MTMSERTRVQNESFVRLAWQENERRGGYLSSWAVIKRLHLWFKAWTISDPKSITLKMEDRYVEGEDSNG